MKHYLVTGGAGFIGSHLADALLVRGNQVTVLDNLSAGKEKNEQVTFIRGSLSDKSLLEKLFNEIDGCFHMAAIPSVIESMENWSGTHEVNFTGTLNLFETARKLSSKKVIPIVYASSSAVYGDCPDLPLKETAYPRPMSAYGADKLSCELQARVAGLVHNLPTFGLRFFNVYGPRQRADSPYSGVISIFIDKFCKKEPLSLFGDGLQSRDFIYIQDVITHCLAAMHHANTKSPVLNVCRGQPTSLRVLIRTLSELFDYQPEIISLPPRIGEIYHSLGDPTLAQKTLGIRAEVELEAGLRKMLE